VVWRLSDRHTVTNILGTVNLDTVNLGTVNIGLGDAGAPSGRIAGRLDPTTTGGSGYAT
jgi:hypothetical protein